MTRAISVIVGGVETQLSSLGSLVSHQGWGMPPIANYTDRSPGQDGDTWVGMNLEPRVGYLVFKSDTSDLDDLYALRDTLLRLFNPLSAMVLKFGAVGALGARCFDVRLAGGLDGQWDVKEWGSQKFSVALRAADPTCYDPAGAGFLFQLSGGADTFTVPYVVPYKLGTSIIDQSIVITYLGSCYSFPVVRITGPITDAILTNEGTGDKLDFTGYTIAAGHYYEIDCRYGLKTVKDDAGVNRSGELTLASNQATFCLAPHPRLAGGINTFRMRGSSVTAATKVEVAYFVKDLGI